MTFRARITARRFVGVCAACLAGGLTAATVAAPSASAAPDCSGNGVANTVRSATGSARQYLAAHPGAGQVLSDAANQPRPEAEANVRGYFSAHPDEYHDLRGILAPIGDTQRQCNVTVLPPDLESAFSEFMAG